MTTNKKPSMKPVKEEQEQEVVYVMEEKAVMNINSFLQLVDASDKAGIIDYKEAFGKLTHLLHSAVKTK